MIEIVRGLSFWATIIGECLPLAIADTAPAGGYLIQSKTKSLKQSPHTRCGRSGCEALLITEKQVPFRSSSLKTTSSFGAMAVRADNSIAVRDSADYRSLNFALIFINARQKC